jgi:hypothetical protein
MTRLVLVGLGFFGALGWAVPAMAQTTVKYQQGTNGYSGCMDTYVDKFWNDFFGGVERIEIRDWDAAATEKMNVLIKFDVTGLPTNATITSAKLTLYSIRARGQNGDVPVVDKVTSAWNNQTTWNTAPTTVATGITGPPVTGYTDDPVTPEVYAITGLAPLVQEWMATPALNYGIMISVPSNLNFRFASSEYPTGSVHPELEVIYTTPNPLPPPTISVTSPPTAAAGTPISVSGTASATSPATVTQVTWANSLSGGSGGASGTTAWTATIPLVVGNNTITMTVTDSNGGTGTTSFTVAYFPVKVAGKGDDTYCGIGAVGGSPGAVAVAALMLALLLISRRRTA